MPDHVAKEKHVINWPGAKILEREGRSEKHLFSSITPTKITSLDKNSFQYNCGNAQSSV